jgi:Zn-dependent alcohol dehydrogenase
MNPAEEDAARNCPWRDAESTKAGDVRVENVPDATIKESTDALIRTVRACICGGDLWPYHDLVPSEKGRPMGHEAIGVVEDVGRDVRKVKKGDFVIMPFAYSDGQSDLISPLEGTKFCVISHRPSALPPMPQKTFPLLRQNHPSNPTQLSADPPSGSGSRTSKVGRRCN